MAKKVRITLELENGFIKLLNAKCQLDGAIHSAMKGDPSRQLDPAEVLAMLVLAEARGGTEEQIHAMTPHEWRSEINLIHEERRVYEGGKQIAGPKFSAS
jgi:hypothetical protein